MFVPKSMLGKLKIISRVHGLILSDTLIKDTIETDIVIADTEETNALIGDITETSTLVKKHKCDD